MKNLLYYPYINLPDEDWTVRNLLYYDNIGSIVPTQYFYEPERYEPFMRKMIQNELIVPINPMDILDHQWRDVKIYIEYLKKNQKRLKQRCSNKFISQTGSSTDRMRTYDPITGSRLHANKFDSEIFYSLTQMGLAKKIDEYWYEVENRTAYDLMFFLATIVANKIDYQPTTNKIQYSPFTRENIKRENIELREQKNKRDLILKDLIPYPEQIDINLIKKFKEKHYDLLNRFRNKVELIALNPSISLDSQLFKTAIEDMNDSKEELIARMSENKFGNIFFGTICGTISACIALSNGPTLSAIPGILNAIYTALKIEKPENVIDQTGLKYLALVHKRLRLSKNITRD